MGSCLVCPRDRIWGTFHRALPPLALVGRADGVRLGKGRDSTQKKGSECLNAGTGTFDGNHVIMTIAW